MSNIISEILNYKNKDGKNIVCYFDYLNRDNNYFVVIPPAYGETKRDSLKLSYYLVKNGFNVIRYDASYHVGESDGDMIDASFPKMKDDLIATLNFVEKEFKANVIGIVGTSLAIRIAIKAAAENKIIKFLLGLVAIVDVRATLKAIYHQDVIGEIIAGKYRGKTIDDIMGFEVSIDFALSAIREKYHDLATVKEDIEKIDIPIVLIYAENDPWVNINDIKSIFNSCPNDNKEFVIIPNAMHQLNENPEAADYALKQTVVKCKKYLYNENLKLEDVIEPIQKEISTQWLIEEERLKNLLRKSLEGEKEFWEKYLNKFVLINKSKDYRGFLKQITDMLDIKQGENILDVGCGNGHFGAWLLESFIEKVFKEKIEFGNFLPINYFGLDFIEDSLREGMLKHFNMVKKIYRELYIRERYKIIRYEYILADLDYHLPFKDCYFDKICCNLVISYVKNPRFTIEELIRTLKPKGKIIISSMKPYADLSQIYRNFVVQTEDDEELQEARKLISAAGRIKQKESAGFYHFFSETELINLIKDILKNYDVKYFRSFANQANLVAVNKY
jgi:SAM-dependent methyltransferase/esterase/lipase